MMFKNSERRDRWNGRSYKWSRPAGGIAQRQWLVARPARYFMRASYRRLRATTPVFAIGYAVVFEALASGFYEDCKRDIEFSLTFFTF